MSNVRLHKWLADRGLGSRRQAEAWIRQGRVTVDGVVASVGCCVSGSELIRVDEQRTRLPSLAARRRVIAYYKPEGQICTRTDPQGRSTVFDGLPAIDRGRWIAVGRLDINTQGLLLLTSDGELANRLMHPRFAVEREYAARVLGAVDEATIERLKTGVPLDGRPARFDAIWEAGGEGANRWFHLVIREGRRREVRRLWESQGLRVSRLVRVRYGNICLRRGLRPGGWDEVVGGDLEALLRTVELVPSPPDQTSARKRGPRPKEASARKRDARHGRRRGSPSQRRS